MNAQPHHPADDWSQARRAEQRAELLEEARDRGRLFWLGTTALIVLTFLAYAFVQMRDPAGGELDTFPGVLALFVLLLSLEARLTRRLDAIVKLLEEEQGLAARAASESR